MSIWGTVSNYIQSWFPRGEVNDNDSVTQPGIQPPTVQGENNVNLETGISLTNLVDSFQSEKPVQGVDSREFRPSQTPAEDDCETDGCCPPEGSSYNSAMQYRNSLMKKEAAWTLRTLSFFSIGVLGIVALLSYLVYSIVMVVVNYFKKLNFKFGSDEAKSRLTRQKDSKPRAENINDYYVYQKGINQAVKRFTHHNNQLRKFYNKADPPGIINQKILNSKFDNW